MKRVWGVLLLVSFVWPGFSGAVELTHVMNELQRIESGLNMIQFDFDQEISFSQMESKTKITGTALFGQSGRLRISKKSPDQQVTVSDGKKVWVYNPAAKQVWSGAVGKWGQDGMLPKGMVPLNNYVTELKKNFDISMDAKTPAGSHEVRLFAQPKNPALGYKLELTISTDIWLPVKTVYISDSARVDTLISRHEINPTHSHAVFKFSPPKGTDVIPFN